MENAIARVRFGYAWYVFML